MHTVNTSRRTWATGAFLFALTGCGVMPPGPRQIDVSEAQLLSRIASRFPVKQRQLGLIDVTLDQPRLRLLPEENRVVTEMAYTVGVALMPYFRPSSLILAMGVEQVPSLSGTLPSSIRSVQALFLSLAQSALRDLRSESAARIG